MTSNGGIGDRPPDQSFRHGHSSHELKKHTGYVPPYKIMAGWLAIAVCAIYEDVLTIKL